MAAEATSIYKRQSFAWLFTTTLCAQWPSASLALGECVSRYCLAHSQKGGMCHLIKELWALEVMLRDEDVIEEVQGHIQPLSTQSQSSIPFQDPGT